VIELLIYAAGLCFLLLAAFGINGKRIQFGWLGLALCVTVPMLKILGFI
jgi:hypothetical protein